MAKKTTIREVITFPVMGVILTIIMVGLALTKLGYISIFTFNTTIEVVILTIALAALTIETVKDGIQVIFADIVGIRYDCGWGINCC